ncbi:unnamed protein product, partial [Rotaria magnacalcarata]
IFLIHSHVDRFGPYTIRIFRPGFCPINFMQIVLAINSSQRILHMESSEWLSYISANSERFSDSDKIGKHPRVLQETVF